MAAGEHTVELEYRPFSFTLGLWSSTAALVSLTLLALLALFRRHGREHGPKGAG